MGVKVWFPCGGISGSAVMPLVTVDEDLQCRDSPPLLAHLTKMLQLLQSGIILDYHRSLVCIARPVFSFTIAAI